MPDGPYRAPPKRAESDADASLARLAQEGDRKLLVHRESTAIDRARAGEELRAERELRLALGGHYGSPLRAVCRVGIAFGSLSSVLIFLSDARLFLLGPPVLLVAALVHLFVAPKATRGRIAAELAWVASLPFTMEGYLETLGSEPAYDCRLSITIRWAEAGDAPAEDVLRGVLGGVDVDARVARRGDGAVVVRSGAISGRTKLRINDDIVYRNTRLVAYVHRLVDGALVPLHRSHAIALASIARE